MKREHLNLIAVPLSVLAAAVFLYVTWQLLNLPSQESMVTLARQYFERYGLITVFLSAILEGALFIGVYYPGSLVIFLGVIFSIGSIPRAIETVAVVTAGLLIGYCIDYVLGRYGWYRLFLAVGLKGPLESAQKRVAAYGPRALFLSYWHPNFAALTSTAAGVLHMEFAVFFRNAVIAAIAWNAFWGLIVYTLGEASLWFMGMPFVLTFVAAWIVVIVIREIWKRNAAATLN